jgi:hypothetical protein
MRTRRAADELPPRPNFVTLDDEAYIDTTSRLSHPGLTVTLDRTQLACEFARCRTVELWATTAPYLNTPTASIPLSQAFDACTYAASFACPHVKHSALDDFIQAARAEWAHIADWLGVSVDRLIAGAIVDNFKTNGYALDPLLRRLPHVANGRVGCCVLAGLWPYDVAVAMISQTGAIEPYPGSTFSHRRYVYDYYHLTTAQMNGREPIVNPILFRNVITLIDDHAILYRRTNTSLPVLVWTVVERILETYQVPVYYSFERAHPPVPVVHTTHYMLCGTIIPFADVILIPMHGRYRQWPTILVTKAPDTTPNTWIIGSFAPGSHVAFCSGRLLQWPHILQNSDLQDWFKYYYDIDVEFTTVQVP